MLPVTKLLDLLPPALLDRLAVQYRVNASNQFRLSGQTVFLCLLHGLLNHPTLTQRLLEETALQLLGHSVDHSSFGKRLAAIKPAYFQALVNALYATLQPTMRRGELQALRLRRVDATVVVLSARLLHFGIYEGSGGRAGPNYPKRHLKSVFELGEEGLPTLLRLCRTPSELNDNPALGDAMLAHTQPGDLWLFDSGCFDRDRLWSLSQAGSYFLTPHRTQSLRPVARLFEAPEEEPSSAVIPAGKAEAACRLVRVEQAVFENSKDRHSAPQRAKWEQLPLIVLHGHRYDRRGKQWRPWTLLTNLPLSADRQQAGPYPFAELTELYRRRWEIETFFKFLKQHLGFAHLTSRCENGIQVMIWMALITALLLIWYQRQTQIDRGWRSVKFWLAEDVRAWTHQGLEADLAAAIPFDGG